MMAKNDWDDIKVKDIVVEVKPDGVHKKLMAARLKLQGMKLNKSGHNKFAGYNYFELGDFLPAIQNIFAELGLCGVISYGKEEAWLTITDTDDGSSLAVCSPMSTAALKGCHEVQNLGAVQTYIRRYLWVTAMEIVEHDALDATTGKDKTKGSPVAETKDDDEPSDEFLAQLAVEVVDFYKSGDIHGAYKHIKSTLVDGKGKFVNDWLERMWSFVHSTPRSAIKSYAAIIYAKTPESLEKVWAATPEHSRKLLEPVKDQRKAELMQPEKEAA